MLDFQPSQMKLRFYPERWNNYYSIGIHEGAYENALWDQFNGGIDA